MQRWTIHAQNTCWELYFDRKQTGITVPFVQGADRVRDVLNMLNAEFSHKEPAYKSVAEYETLTGHKVNEAFKMGWVLARTTMDHIQPKEVDNGPEIHPTVTRHD